MCKFHLQYGAHRLAPGGRQWRSVLPHRNMVRLVGIGRPLTPFLVLECFETITWPSSGQRWVEWSTGENKKQKLAANRGFLFLLFRQGFPQTRTIWLLYVASVRLFTPLLLFAFASNETTIFYLLE